MKDKLHSSYPQIVMMRKIIVGDIFKPKCLSYREVPTTIVLYTTV